MIDVIAQRTLENGAGASVLVELGRPLSDGDAFGCTYRLDCGDGQRTKTIYGADSFQALMLAIKMISVELELADGTLYWLEPGNGTGFPNPDAL